MLNEEDARYLIESAKKMRGSIVGGGPVVEEFDRRMAQMEKDVREPLELLIHCPRCLKQHIDEGHFATHAHTKHACQFCGLAFVASKQPSIGVQFFSGWKNESSKQLELIR